MLSSAKIHYAGIFSIIANFRYESENHCAKRNFCFLFLCSNESILVFLLSTLVIAFVLVCFCNFPCSAHYIS